MNTRRSNTTSFNEARQLYNALREDFLRLRWIIDNYQSKMKLTMDPVDEYFSIDRKLGRIKTHYKLMWIMFGLGILSFGLYILSCVAHSSSDSGKSILLLIFFALSFVYGFGVVSIAEMWTTMMEGWLKNNWDTYKFYYDIIDLLETFDTFGPVDKVESSIGRLFCLWPGKGDKDCCAPSFVVDKCEEKLYGLIIKVITAISKDDKDVEATLKREVSTFFDLCTRLGTLRPNIPLHQYYGLAKSQLEDASKVPVIQE